MTTEEIGRAYTAIAQYVRTHASGDTGDLYCACCNAFDRLKNGYNEDDGSVEDFAMGVAHGQLANERVAQKYRKCREVEYCNSRALDRGKTAEQKRVYALTNKALAQLPDKQFIIMSCDLHDLNLHRLAEIWELPWETFRRNKLEPARDAFAKAFGKVVGNEKWYAQLRREMKNKKLIKNKNKKEN